MAKITGINQSEQKIIADILDKYNKNYKFYYYGSRVKGNFEKTSDLDILIKGKTSIPQDILDEIKSLFDESALPFIVNFCDFYEIDERFYNLIKKDLIEYNQIF